VGTGDGLTDVLNDAEGARWSGANVHVVAEVGGRSHLREALNELERSRLFAVELLSQHRHANLTHQRSGRSSSESIHANGVGFERAATESGLPQLPLGDHLVDWSGLIDCPPLKAVDTKVHHELQGR
jgi:hypothetical protein